MNKLEKKLANYHHRKYCLLVGNGTTAIYLSLVSQNFKNKNIAIPNNVCMNVVLPIYFSENFPIFVDIEKETLGIDISKLYDKQIDGIIAVHSYGNICEIEKIEEYCKKHNIFLIEDVAVSQGMKYKNKPLGSFGDVSILSFGSGKNIDIGHGGVILTDNENIYNFIKELIKILPEFTNDNETIIDKISKKHTTIYNIDYGKSLNKYANEFKKLCIQNKNSFLYKFNDDYIDLLNIKIGKLSNYLEIRKENAEYLKNKFKNMPNISIIEPKYSSSFWRFNIFIEKYRDELFKYLLNKKYKISSWYHSIDLLFEDISNRNFPISDWVGENIINIWTNEDIDKEYLENISNDIIDFLKDKDVR